MPCCQKKRKQKVKQLKERRLWEADAFGSLRLIKGKDINKLNKTMLLNFHRQLHKLYNGAIKHKPFNKGFINEVSIVHNEYVKVLLKRGMEHTSPILRPY